MTVVFALLLFVLTHSTCANEGVNFAKGKPTWQSSITADGESSRAVDGYKNPYYDHNSCMQTQNQYEPWWVVDLEQEVYVTSVHITNRADCCWTHLANFDVRIGMKFNDSGKLSPQCGATYTYNVGAGETHVVSCEPPSLGRYVTVVITGHKGTLNFCEVEVYGYQRHNVFSVKATSWGARDYSEGKRSSWTVENEQNEKSLGRAGHFVVYFSMKTGKKLGSENFNTAKNIEAPTDMISYIQNMPSEVFILVIMHNIGYKYYKKAIPLLESLSGYEPISDKLAYGDSWSLLGYKGKLHSPSWRSSVMKNMGYGPAVVEAVIPKLLVPTNPPSSIVIVALTSSSFTLTWSRPSGLVTEKDLPLNYTVCVRQSGSVVTDCLDNGKSCIYTKSGLLSETEYKVSVKAQSYSGIGPEAVVNVATMKEVDSVKMEVELVSRVKDDILYRSDSETYSSIIIGGQKQIFDQRGFHFIVLAAKTGVQIAQKSFGIHDVNSSNAMTQFVSTVPKPSIILMVVHYHAYDLYNASVLQAVCPSAPSSYDGKDSWSMVCMNGFGTMPWVTSKTSSSDKGPAVIRTYISFPKDLKKAPVLDSLIAVGSRTLQLKWTEPDTNEFTGKISYYEICVQQSNNVSANCSLKSLEGDRNRATLRDLYPFLEYSVKIRGVVAVGYGPYSSARVATTLQAEPSSGPTNVTFPRITVSSMLVSWSKPLESDRNGIITQYSVCYQSVDDTYPCRLANTSNMSFAIGGLRPYQNIKLEIKAATVIGFGPPTTVYERTAQSVPDGPPLRVRATHVNATNISLSWLPPEPTMRNGEIINYTVCIRVYSLDPGPCMKEAFVGNGTHYTATMLEPYTTYRFEITAGTIVGFGPPAFIVNSTLQSAPSGPPRNLNVTRYTTRSMDITWSPPEPAEVNGIITQYSVCIKNPSSKACLRGNVVLSTQTSYSFSGLRPFVLYDVEVRAATVKGFGPIGNITQRTAEARPEGPPRTLVRYVDGTRISFTWWAPKADLKNGMIINYTVCIREYGPDFACTRKKLITTERKSYQYDKLNPLKEYIVVIKAATAVGYGPPAFIQKTEGKCDLPVMHREGNVEDSGFTASGYLGRNYEPRQGRIDGELPWCDSGTRSNSYLQVDLGKWLRVFGVATKGHKAHWRSWVSSYRVSYSIDSIIWRYVNVSGKTVIAGNKGNDAESQHFLDEPILARFIRFEVHSFVGLHPCMGIEVYGCAPATPLSKLSLTKTKKNVFEVRWKRWGSESKNGALFGYKICHRLSSSTEPCLTSDYVGENATRYHVRGLQPYTDYEIEVSAGTVAGYGPPVILHAKTAESIPTGPPRSIKVRDIAARSLTLEWFPPEEELIHGIITAYGICYQESKLRTNCKSLVTVVNQTYYDVTEGLKPNAEYTFIVTPATSAGWGEVSGEITAITLESAPTGPPTSVRVVQIGSNILQMFWEPPEIEDQNGDITGYRVCVKKRLARGLCRNYVTLPGTQLMYTVDKLKPYTVYSMHVEAKTKVGYGPTYVGDYRTGEAAPSAPPKDIAIRAVSSTSIEIMWSAPDEDKQNGVLAMYEVVVHKQLPNSKVEKIRRSMLRANMTSWKYTKLSPSTDYIFHIKAGTSAGFGPAVIVHKRSDGDAFQTSRLAEGKLTAGGIAGGVVMFMALIASCFLSVLWNKGMLPHTKTRKMRLEAEKQKRRRKRQRKRRRSSEISERGLKGTTLSPEESQDSEYSELDDYDTPKAKRMTESRAKHTPKPVTTEDLYHAENVYGETQNIYRPKDDGFEAEGQGIYGTDPPDIYAAEPLQDSNENALVPGEMVPQKSNTILPPIVPQSSLVLPLEATISSMIFNGSQTIGHKPDAKPPYPNGDPQSIPSAFAIPQPSKFSPIIPKPTVGSKVGTFSPGTPLPPIQHAYSFPAPNASMNNHPLPEAMRDIHDDPYSMNSHSLPETKVEILPTSSTSQAARENVARSDLSPVPIFRRPQNAPIPQSATHPSTNRSARIPSIHYHPNMPRYSIDFMALNNPRIQQDSPRLPTNPKIIPVPRPRRSSSNPGKQRNWPPIV